MSIFPELKVNSDVQKTFYNSQDLNFNLFELNVKYRSITTKNLGVLDLIELIRFTMNGVLELLILMARPPF